MSLRARVDKLSRELCFGELFDGATMEELSAHVWGDGPARPGVLRAITSTAIRGIWMDLHDPDRTADAREALEDMEIDPDAPIDEIRERLLALGSQEGLNAKELNSLRQAIGAESSD